VASQLWCYQGSQWLSVYFFNCFHISLSALVWVCLWTNDQFVYDIARQQLTWLCPTCCCHVYTNTRQAVMIVICMQLLLP
jgi:hypothetical protein